MNTSRKDYSDIILSVAVRMYFNLNLTFVATTIEITPTIEIISGFVILTGEKRARMC